MYSLSRQQKIANLKETLSAIEEKIAKLQLQKDGICRKIERLELLEDKSLLEEIESVSKELEESKISNNRPTEFF